MEPICIVPAGDVCGEAATWDAAANRVYWTDINRFLLHSHDPDSLRRLVGASWGLL